MRVAAVATLTLLAAAAGAVGALETDQYYAWGRPLADSTVVLNAKINLEIDAVLAEINERPDHADIPCPRVAKRIWRHFRLFLFHDLELWVINTPLVDRVPADPDEELEYRKRYLYHNTWKLDTGVWMPPSPTVEVAGVRIGTDKLTHLIGTSWWYHGWYRKALGRGATHEDAVDQAIRRGLMVERTVLGSTASGVLSPGDLEANYQGMLFYNGLCDAADPRLVHHADGWVMTPPFDLRDHVTPEWDESYEPSIFSDRRWRKVRPVLLTYCPMLGDPDVRRQRGEYAARDRDTVTEALIRELVAEGRLEDSGKFSLDAVCASGTAEEARIDPNPSPAADPRSEGD